MWHGEDSVRIVDGAGFGSFFLLSRSCLCEEVSCEAASFAARARPKQPQVDHTSLARRACAASRGLRPGNGLYLLGMSTVI
jgi:hypothetical protein